MKKFLLSLFVLIFIFALATIALAGGYKPFDVGTKYTTRPHGPFADLTNFCKTCHAVHLAGESGYLPGTTDPRGDSWRLLRASSVENECYYCHELPGGHTNKVVYTGTLGSDKWGEHTIGATSIPDSNLVAGTPSTTANSGTFYGGAGLSCNNCHSVHGAKTLEGDLNAGTWATKILREDPYGNSGSAKSGIRDIPGPSGGTPYATTPIDSTTVPAGFCGDCHTLNVNWTDETNPNDPRLNVHTHPMNTDGTMIVNGQPITVSGVNVSECTSCHLRGSDPAGDPQFPHQSQGHKLLRNTYTPPTYPLGAGEDVNNPQRQLPSLDFICRTCHGAYVGVTF